MIPKDRQYIYHNPKPEGASTSNHLHLPSPLQIEISAHYKAHKVPGFKKIVSLYRMVYTYYRKHCFVTWDQIS